ncbi:MAG: acylneuraminate cytidylyltransferase family protein, partial [Magnetococcales bacterium]|nr:acylneuraminate cytidylyltransferase family protein [Magnetococcales bacterium]
LTPEVDRVIVSTDSWEIAEIARAAGAEVPDLRPPELALDSTPTEPVLLHVLDAWCPHRTPDVVILLQPTSPLRLPHAIGNAIRQFDAEQADSLVSVCASHAFFWKKSPNTEALYNFKNRPRRQDIHPHDRQYRENGSIYLSKSSGLQQYHNRLFGKIALFEMTEEESWEIDSETDLAIVAQLMKEYLP